MKITPEYTSAVGGVALRNVQDQFPVTVFVNNESKPNFCRHIAENVTRRINPLIWKILKHDSQGDTDMLLPDPTMDPHYVLKVGAVLGQGTSGIAYLATLVPKTCGLKPQEAVLKVTRLASIETMNAYQRLHTSQGPKADALRKKIQLEANDPFNDAVKEVLITHVCSRYVEESKLLVFPLMFGSFRGMTTAFKAFDFPVAVQCMVMERMIGTLGEELRTGKMDGPDGEISGEMLLAALAQVIFGLLAALNLINFGHYDLSETNVMFVKTDVQFIYYCVGKRTYKVPTFGKIWKVMDFGRATVRFYDKDLGGDVTVFAHTDVASDEEGLRDIVENMNTRVDEVGMVILMWYLHDIVQEFGVKGQPFEELVTRMIQQTLTCSNGFLPDLVNRCHKQINCETDRRYWNLWRKDNPCREGRPAKLVKYLTPFLHGESLPRDAPVYFVDSPNSDGVVQV